MQLLKGLMYETDLWEQNSSAIINVFGDNSDEGDVKIPLKTLPYPSHSLIPTPTALQTLTDGFTAELPDEMVFKREVPSRHSTRKHSLLESSWKNLNMLLYLKIQMEFWRKVREEPVKHKHLWAAANLTSVPPPPY